MNANTLEQIFSVNLEKVPVMTRDRFIPRKEQARLCRELFKRLGIKGVSVTAPNYSMAQSVDVSLPGYMGDDSEYVFDGINYRGQCFSDMPDQVPAKIRNRTHWNAAKKVDEILLRAFPAHDDRSDLQSDYFNYKWSVS